MYYVCTSTSWVRLAWRAWYGVRGARSLLAQRLGSLARRTYSRTLGVCRSPACALTHASALHPSSGRRIGAGGPGHGPPLRAFHGSGVVPGSGAKNGVREVLRAPWGWARERLPGLGDRPSLRKKRKYCPIYSKPATRVPGPSPDNPKTPMISTTYTGFGTPDPSPGYRPASPHTQGGSEKIGSPSPDVSRAPFIQTPEPRSFHVKPEPRPGPCALASPAVSRETIFPSPAVSRETSFQGAAHSLGHGPF